jgi:carbonic anhydrase
MLVTVEFEFGALINGIDKRPVVRAQLHRLRVLNFRLLIFHAKKRNMLSTMTSRILLSTVLAAFALTSCSSLKFEHRSSDQTQTEKEVLPEIPKTEAPPLVKLEKAPGATAANPSPIPENVQIPENVPADKALQWLKNGNRRFVKKWFRKDGKGAKDRAAIAKGQHPHSAVLGCADSRLPPEIIFDQALGELFTVRTAAPSLDAGVVSSLEFAALHLGTRLLVVLGSPACDGVLSNPKAVAEELTRRSEVLRSLEAKEHLKILPVVYNLTSGEVIF